MLLDSRCSLCRDTVILSPSRFLAECRKRRLNQGSVVLPYFVLFELYLVCVFSCTVLFVSISQVIGCEDCLQNDLDCIGWGVKLNCNYKFLFVYTDYNILQKYEMTDAPPSTVIDVCAHEVLSYISYSSVGLATQYN